MKPVIVTNAKALLDPSNETYISDFVRKFSKAMGISDIIKTVERDSTLEDYERVKSLIKKSGYDFYEVPSYMTDGQKGKEFGKNIYVRKGQKPIEKTVVSWHEYFAKLLGYHDDKMIQKIQEMCFSPRGIIPNKKLYRATVEMGGNAGIR